jgi:hypothetical protein
MRTELVDASGVTAAFIGAREDESVEVVGVGRTVVSVLVDEARGDPPPADSSSVRPAAAGTTVGTAVGGAGEGEGTGAGFKTLVLQTGHTPFCPSSHPRTSSSWNKCPHGNSMTVSPFSKSHKQKGHSTIEGNRRVGTALLRREERAEAGVAGTGGRMKEGRKRWTTKGSRANARWASEGAEADEGEEAEEEEERVRGADDEEECGRRVVASSGSLTSSFELEPLRGDDTGRAARPASTPISRSSSDGAERPVGFSGAATAPALELHVPAFEAAAPPEEEGGGGGTTWSPQRKTGSRATASLGARSA